MKKYPKSFTRSAKQRGADTQTRAWCERHQMQNRLDSIGCSISKHHTNTR